MKYAILANGSGYEMITAPSWAKVKEIARNKTGNVLNIKTVFDTEEEAKTELTWYLQHTLGN